MNDHLKGVELAKCSTIELDCEDCINPIHAYNYSIDDNGAKICFARVNRISARLQIHILFVRHIELEKRRDTMYQCTQL